MDSLLLTIIIITALGSALMAGMFFTFSNFVMTALGQLPAPQGILAMQRINVVIMNPLFFVAFAGTAILCLGLPFSLFWRAPHPNEIYLVIACVCYILSVMLVTGIFNVPMNNELEAVEPNSSGASILWQRYLIVWTRWNHVRSIGALISTLCFILALI